MPISTKRACNASLPNPVVAPVTKRSSHSSSTLLCCITIARRLQQVTCFQYGCGQYRGEVYSMINPFSGVKMSTNPLLDQRSCPIRHRVLIDQRLQYRPCFLMSGVRQNAWKSEAVNHPAAPDFTNTLLALEQCGALRHASPAFFAMTAARTLTMNLAVDEGPFSAGSWRRSPTIFI